IPGRAARDLRRHQAGDVHRAAAHLLHRVSSHGPLLRQRRPARLPADATDVGARSLLGTDAHSLVAGAASRLCVAVAGGRAHGGADGMVAVALVAASNTDAGAASSAVRGPGLA